MALGINQISALAGQFLGLVAGGLLAAWDWRAVFWVNVPVGIFGTIWAYRSLREIGARQPRPHRLVGQPHLRRSGCGADPGRASPTASSPTAATPWAGPAPRCWPA